MQVTVRIQLTVDTQICLWMGNSQRGNDKQYETNQQIRHLARLKHMLEIEPDQLGKIKEYILL